MLYVRSVHKCMVTCTTMTVTGGLTALTAPCFTLSHLPPLLTSYVLHSSSPPCRSGFQAGFFRFSFIKFLLSEVRSQPGEAPAAGLDSVTGLWAAAGPAWLFPHLWGQSSAPCCSPGVLCGLLRLFARCPPPLPCHQPPPPSSLLTSSAWLCPLLLPGLGSGALRSVALSCAGISALC